MNKVEAWGVNIMGVHFSTRRGAMHLLFGALHLME